MRRKAGTLIDIEIAILSAALLLLNRGERSSTAISSPARSRWRTATAIAWPQARSTGRSTAWKKPGLLTSSWEDPAASSAEGRPPRRLYRVTPEAKRRTARRLKELPEGALSQDGSRHERRRCGRRKAAVALGESTRWGSRTLRIGAPRGDHERYLRARPRSGVRGSPGALAWDIARALIAGVPDDMRWRAPISASGEPRTVVPRFRTAAAARRLHHLSHVRAGVPRCIVAIVVETIAASALIGLSYLEALWTLNDRVPG